jgi:DNA (cytosine-5)-methyltransferase 1
MKEFKHLELFAGIGGFRRAIDLYCLDNNFKSNCVGFSEIDNHAVRTYKAIHDVSCEIELGDITEFTRNIENVQSLQEFSLLTGGFPCQAFSMMGKKRGFIDSRGEVFYRIIDILKEKKPKFILLENVRNLKLHDNKNTYHEIIRSLSEDADYLVDSVTLDTKKFGLPQTRRRLFIFGIHKNYIKEERKVVLNDFEIETEALTLNGCTSLNKYLSMLEILDQKVDSKYYLSEKIKPTILSNGSKKFESKSEINQLIARPLTASMVKMHRACQDNYYSDEFLLSKSPQIYLETFFTKQELANHSIRKITPEEAFKLQGFNREDAAKARAVGISDHQLYRQAGNAVSVNTVYAILHYLNKKYSLLNG